MSVNVTGPDPGDAAQRVSARFCPWLVPVVIAALAVLAEAFGESGRAWLRYEREAIGDGELWRLITGHLVHLGPSHALMNIAALAVLTLLLTRYLKPLDWLWLFLIPGFAIAGGLFWFSPDIAWYVGLSGVLHGYWAGASIIAWQQDRLQSIVLTTLLVFKLSYEAASGPVPFTGAIAAGPVIAVAHAYGAIGGAGFGLIALAIRSRKPPL